MYKRIHDISIMYLYIFALMHMHILIYAIICLFNLNLVVFYKDIMNSFNGV